MRGGGIKNDSGASSSTTMLVDSDSHFKMRVIAMECEDEIFGRKCGSSGSTQQKLAYTFKDFQRGAVLLKDEGLWIDWHGAIDVPEWIQRELAGTLHCMQTCADGGCAVHAAFGDPSADRQKHELYAPNARLLASTLLNKLPNMISETPVCARLHESIKML